MIGSRYHAMVLSVMMVSVLYKGFKFKALQEILTLFSIMVFVAFTEWMPC